MNQEDSEQNEVDGMKKGAASVCLSFVRNVLWLNGASYIKNYY